VTKYFDWLLKKILS